MSDRPNTPQATPTNIESELTSFGAAFVYQPDGGQPYLVDPRKLTIKLADHNEIKGEELNGQLSRQDRLIREARQRRDADQLQAARDAIDRYGPPPPGEGTHPLQQHRDSMG